MQDKPNLTKLPAGVAFEILSRLSPEDISSVAMINRELYKKIPANKLLWQEKFDQHFPDIPAGASIDGQSFRDMEKIQYKGMTLRTKKIISLMKEEDIKSLKTLGLTLEELDPFCKTGKLILKSAKKNPKLCNYFYELAIEKYKDQTQNTIDTNKKDLKNRTILFWFIVFHQSLSTLELLILQDANIYLKNGGYDLIRVAAQQGNAKVVQFLIDIDAGVDINRRSAKGATALLIAVEHGHIDVVKILLKQANIDITLALLQDSSGYHDEFDVKAGDNPLHAAIKLGYKDIVELLVNQGADINVQTDGSNALHLAAKFGHVDILEFLIQQDANVNAQTYRGATALLLAVERGHIDVIRHLLKQPNINVELALQEDSDYHDQFRVFAGDIPLHAAIKQGRLDMVEVLIDHGANIHAVVRGFNPLRLAATEGHADIVEFLIKSGAQVNERDVKGATALLMATEKRHVRVVDVLLKHNADVTIPLHTNGLYHKQFKVVAGDTALHVASRFGDVRIMQRFLSNKADIDAVNSKNKTPVDVAKKKTHYAQELKLLRYIAKFSHIQKNHYETTFNFFGHRFTYTNKKKQERDAQTMEAAIALKAVIFDSVDKSCLDPYKDILNKSDFAPIAHSLNIR